MRSTCVSFRIHLRRLGLICDDLRWLWSSSNSYASFSPFGHPTQVDTSWPQVICIRVKFTPLRLAWTCDPTCELVWPPFASPYASAVLGHLRKLASPSGQGLKQGLQGRRDREEKENDARKEEKRGAEDSDQVVRYFIASIMIGDLG